MMNKSIELCRAFYKGKVKCIHIINNSNQDSFLEKISDSLTVSLRFSVESIIESLESNPKILPKTFNYGNKVCHIVGYLESDTGVLIYFKNDDDDIAHSISVHELIMKVIKGKANIIFNED